MERNKESQSSIPLEYPSTAETSKLKDTPTVPSETPTTIPQSLKPRIRPSFATPLLQSTRSQTLQWTLPKPFQQHKLIGRSRAAWHTSFLVPSLNAVLDAGVLIDDSRPQNVFITHGHSDHSLAILAYCRRITPPDVYVPSETAMHLDNYIMSSKALNLGFSVTSYHNFDEEGNRHSFPNTVGGRLIPWGEQFDRLRLNTPSPSRRSKTPSPVPPTDTPAEPEDDDLDDGGGDPADLILPTHHIIPVSSSSSTIFPLKTHPTISVSILPRSHTVPSVGFLFTQTSNRLKSEYRSLPGTELKNLRQQGVDITYQHRTPIFAFLGDGDHTSLLGDPEWLVGNEDKGVSGCPVVITECSFLYESHRAQAVKTKHTIWKDLEPIVRRHRDTTWVLMHFSKRYGDGEIVEFFEGLEECPQNIVVWVDGGNEIVDMKVKKDTGTI
ncbi:hypothetical protein TWF102_002792 [Orbilia oligospora]|uniref:Metallo-beta-lactamase domain-containing protein n=1 Tax=Orbilia oligospora TaxID=2813651 RepID=A0A7C8MV71_ORBOL|nr:hypothetical protein TWF102_002792 [Orbilia oligospora]